MVNNVELSEIALLLNGDRSSNYPSDADFISYGVPFVNTGHLSDGKIDYSRVDYISKAKANSLSGAKIVAEDILLCLRGTLGKYAFVEKDGGAPASSLVVIRANKDKILPRFLYYVVSSNIFQHQILIENNGSSQPNLSAKSVMGFRVPFPTKKEQQAVSNVLSDIDALIENLEKLISKKKAIKQGAMQELLTGKLRLPGFKKEWTNKKLSELCDIEMGQSPDSRYYSSSEGVPLVQGNADIEDRQTIIRFFTKNITKKATKGDIIFTVRAPVGNVAHAMFDCCIGRGVCALQSGSDFLYHLLVFKQDMWSTVSSGSTFDSINSDTLCNTMLFVPVDEKEQIAIARILTDMDEEITILEKRLVKTKNIKAGMMSELLTGRIRLIDKEDV